MFIKQALEKHYKRIIIFLGVFGPATITAISDNDAAGVATYSLAGAQFGYSLLFILLIVTILLAMTQEMGVRIAIVARKGLGDIIRERYGVNISLLVFLCLFVANMGTIVANFSALKAVSSMFEYPVIPIILSVIIFSAIFITKGNYQTNQKLFFVGIILYFSYVISAVKGNPDWGRAFTSLVVPTGFTYSKEFILSAIAVVGTTITPWGQFFIQSYVNDKKIILEGLRYSQFETYFGALLTNFFSFFMVVATASTLFIHSIPLISGEQAALAIRPFAGELASVLFGLGLLNAAIMGIIIVSLTTTYIFGEFFGVERSLDVPYERGKAFYGLFFVQLIIAAFISLLPFISLFKIVFITQAINGALLPLVFFFLLKITNNKEIMGEHINNKYYNYFAVTSSVLIVIASIFIVLTAIFNI
ncbi:divalent metal cation transporter [Candidatus Parcubacteria bacterium]|nr:MAG: divalent metal cation transporter [Candidatus Parcubacteria bacterium]